MQTQLMVKPGVTNSFFFPKNHNISKPNSPCPQFLTKKHPRDFSFPLTFCSSTTRTRKQSKPQKAECIYSQTLLNLKQRKHNQRKGAGLPNQPTTSLHPSPPTSPRGRDGNPKKHWWDRKENTQSRRSWWHLKEKEKKIEEKESRRGEREGSNWQRGMQCYRDKKTS